MTGGGPRSLRKQAVRVFAGVRLWVSWLRLADQKKKETVAVWTGAVGFTAESVDARSGGGARNSGPPTANK